MDLLTAADLEELRARKRRGDPRPADPAIPPDRRYLIVTRALRADREESRRRRGARRGYSVEATSGGDASARRYAVEFDRVHYPLPLDREAAPTPASLERQLRRARRKIRGLEARQPAAGDDAARGRAESGVRHGAEDDARVATLQR